MLMSVTEQDSAEAIRRAMEAGVQGVNGAGSKASLQGHSAVANL